MKESVCWLYLWVHVQDADLSCFYHLVYRVDLGPVQVTIILAVLQKTGIFDVTLHLIAGHEGIHLAIPLIYLWLSRGDWGKQKNPNTEMDQFMF